MDGTAGSGTGRHGNSGDGTVIFGLMLNVVTIPVFAYLVVAEKKTASRTDSRLDGSLTVADRDPRGVGVVRNGFWSGEKP